MKKDNNSKDLQDWTTKKLKYEAISLDEMIFKVECYGIRDLMRYYAVLDELSKRGVEPKTELTF